MQNILLTSIRSDHTAELVERSRALGVAIDGSPFQRGTASCTGSEYCKLALTETKLFSIRLAQELEDRVGEIPAGVTGLGVLPRAAAKAFRD